ncbi:MAG: bacillithiol biosynthesis cysteine-adding enzyme BshC [Flavobacteriaceae bacterium]
MKLIESLGYHTSVYAPLMQQLLSNDPALSPFYTEMFSTTASTQAVSNRATSFDQSKRNILVEVLHKQYEHLDPDDKIGAQIDALSASNTLTITTGHQLNLFTGPLYFWYKILDVINKAEAMQQLDGKHQYVPVFWMASEDHDFEEINHFFLGEQKVSWESDTTGAVGRMSTTGLDTVLEELTSYWKNTEKGKELLSLFADCFLQEGTLVKATRKLVHQLFGAYGIIVIDGDDAALKSLFVPLIKAEVSEQITHKAVTQTNSALKKVVKDFKPQVNPREINLFYLSDDKRLRITTDSNLFGTIVNPSKWTLQSLCEEIHRRPERFSPNALMRPLYQECVLPNIAYVGGGGELAYWLQLKTTFEAFDIPYPLLHLRNSVLLMSEKQVKKCNKLNLPIADLFLPSAAFVNKRVRQISNINIDFSLQREMLKNNFKTFHDLATQTDKSFLGAVEAQEKKQLKGLDKLESRLLKAQRKKLQDEVVRATEIRNNLFPHNRLQERTAHFSTFVSDSGIHNFTAELKTTLSNAENGLAVIQI